MLKMGKDSKRKMEVKLKHALKKKMTAASERW